MQYNIVFTLPRDGFSLHDFEINSDIFDFLLDLQAKHSSLIMKDNSYLTKEYMEACSDSTVKKELQTNYTMCLTVEKTTNDVGEEITDLTLECDYILTEDAKNGVIYHKDIYDNDMNTIQCDMLPYITECLKEINEPSAPILTVEDVVNKIKKLAEKI